MILNYILLRILTVSFLANPFPVFFPDSPLVPPRCRLPSTSICAFSVTSESGLLLRASCVSFCHAFAPSIIILEPPARPRSVSERQTVDRPHRLQRLLDSRATGVAAAGGPWLTPPKRETVITKLLLLLVLVIMTTLARTKACEKTVLHTVFDTTY